MNRTTPKRFSANVAATYAVRLVMTANSVVAGVLIARLLGADSLGTYLVLTATIQILIQVGAFSFSTANTYFTASDKELLPAAFTNSIFFAFVGGGLVVSGLLLASGSILPGLTFEIALLGLLAVPFQIATICFMHFFLARGEVGRFNWIDLTNQSFILINVLVALLVLGRGIQSLVVFNTVAAALMAAVSAAMLLSFFRANDLKATWWPNIGLFRKMVAYSAKGSILWASIFLMYRLDLLIVNFFREAAEAAVYAVATQVTLFLLVLPYVASQLLQAKVSAVPDDDGEFTCRVTRATALLMFVACIVSVPGAFLVAFAYGPGFEGLPLLLWILLPGVFFVGVQQILVQYFLGSGSPMRSAMAWLATLVVSIVANVLVVPTYGAIGAAVVSSVSYIVVSVAIFALFSRVTGKSFAEIVLPRKNDVAQLWLLFRKGIGMRPSLEERCD